MNTVDKLTTSEAEPLFACAPFLPSNREILAYWLKLPREDGLPHRADLSPSEIKSYLPLIWMVDVVDGGADYRVRLYGTRCSQEMGLDATGMLLSELPFPARTWESMYRHVVAAREPVCVRHRLNEIGREHVEVESLILPFRLATTSVDLIVGHFDIVRSTGV